ncbi:DMT family transporter [Azospirillum halopraeferens]|uniref:DMT family transporter n=1 Tax=Azospirillum halopraeferens TaxID=34010 RepID=UPI00041AB9B6|nr:DMT family transporter [Azospirillum halopraeferens]
MPSSRPEGNLTGIGLAVAGFALFSAADGLIKHLSTRYPLVEVVFFNALFSLVFIAAAAMIWGGPAMLTTRRPGIHLLRGLFGLAAGYGAFFGFSHMPMADVYAILFSSPLIIAALAGVLLGERVDARRWVAVLVGFAGVLVMLRPGSGAVNVGVLGAMVGALGYSASALVVRRYGAGETPFSFPFFGNCVVTAVLALFQPFIFVPPAPGDLALMALAGLFGGMALICTLGAFRIAPAPVVAPFQYTQMVWGVLLGVLVFGDLPSPWLAVGGGLVVASGLYLLQRERRAARRSAPVS